MDDSLRGQIKIELSSHSTEDLVDIWKLQDTDEWEPETFRIIREILIERLGELPEIPPDIALPRIFGQLEDCLKRKAYEQGLCESDEAVRLAPENAEAHNYRGLFYDYLGQREKSLEEYKEAVRLDPDFKNARENLVDIQYELAEKDRGTAKGPARMTGIDLSLENQIRENFRLMDTQDLLKIWRDHDIDEWTPQAFDVLRDVLTTRLGNVPEVTNAQNLHNTLATIRELSYNGDNFNALNMCRKALEEAPDFPITNYLHGMVLIDLDRYDDAYAAFSKTISIDPDYKDASGMMKKLEKDLSVDFDQSAAMGFLESALEYAADEDFDLANDEIKKAQALLPETAGAYTTFGEVLLAAHRPDEALEYFDKAVRLHPGYSRARAGMHDAHVQIKQQPLYLEIKVEPADVEEVEKKAEIFDEEEFEIIQDEVEETPEWVYLGKDAILVKGTPGHRNRSGRSGLDPLDTQMEAYRFLGGLLHRVFNGHLRTHDPVYLIFMLLFCNFFLCMLPFLMGSIDWGDFLINKFPSSWIIFIIPIIGLAIFYNFIASFFSDKPDGFEDSNDKFF